MTRDHLFLVGVVVEASRVGFVLAQEAFYIRGDVKSHSRVRLRRILRSIDVLHHIEHIVLRVSSLLANGIPVGTSRIASNSDLNLVGGPGIMSSSYVGIAS